jgi:hypothetical protein
MRLHPAFVAIVSLVVGVSAVSFAAVLATSKPRPTPVRVVEGSPPPASLVPVVFEHAKELVPLNLITLPEVKVTAAIMKPKVVEPEYVERCREVYLDQGAAEGKTVVYCERRRKEDLP